MLLIALIRQLYCVLMTNMPLQIYMTMSGKMLSIFTHPQIFAL